MTAAVVEAMRARRVFRDHDLVVERGSDQILVLAVIAKDDVPRILTRVRRDMARLAAETGGLPDLRFRYGWAGFPDDARTAAELIEKAAAVLDSEIPREEHP
jgi:hypothetical protein